jgi:GT2 family glycosyltransferase
MSRTVTAVIVTYGDRWSSLSLLLEHLSEDRCIAKIILIDNNSKYDVASRCTDGGFTKVHTIVMQVNCGSASGFAAGMRVACESEAEYIMLFDDDTVPLQSTIAPMVDRLQALNKVTGSKINAVVPLRDSQMTFLRNKFSKNELWLADESVIGLNVFNFLQRHLKGKRGGQPVMPVIGMAYGHAPYGGLMFHKDLCKVNGFPNEEYVLYYDDIDYTHRILEKGGNVWLCTEAYIRDVDVNYSATMMSRPFLGFIYADSDTKVYYQIRNQIHFEFTCMSRHKCFFLINAAVFSFFALVLSLSLLRFRRARVLLEAISHGLLGKLGMHPLYTLPQ